MSVQIRSFPVVLVKLNLFGLEVVPVLNLVNAEKLRDQGGDRSPRLRSPFQKHRDQVEVHHRPIEARVPQMFLIEVHHHQGLHVHDDRVQAVAIGVDPAEYGRMISEAQQLIDESQGRAALFEGLSKDIYPKLASKFNNF